MPKVRLKEIEKMQGEPRTAALLQWWEHRGLTMLDKHVFLLPVMAHIERLEGHLAQARDAAEMIEACLCDKELCGHYLAEEIRGETKKILKLTKKEAR